MGFQLCGYCNAFIINDLTICLLYSLDFYSSALASLQCCLHVGQMTSENKVLTR